MTHTGGCHCGQVRFSADVELTEVISCNCSICVKRGYLLKIIPAENFTLQAGEDSLVDYTFGPKTVHHFFCKTCGTGTFGRGAHADGTQVVAVNLRCLDEVDIESLPLVRFNGKDL